MQGEPWYHSPFRQENTPSFKLTVDRKAFFDHGLGKGGNILDFAMLYFQSSLSEALREIERVMGSPTRRAAAQGGQYSLLPDAAPAARTPSPPPEPEPEPDTKSAGFTDVKVQALMDPRLLRYVQERGITPALAREYVQEIRYTYQERRYFALAFANDAGGMDTRNAYFKGVFGKKAITTLHAQGEVSSVTVFEGVFDFLSAKAWNSAAVDGAVIVMNSVAMKAQTLEAIRRIGAPVVRLFLDNDHAGRTLAAELSEELTGLQVVDSSSVYAGYKDFNEFWQEQQRQTGAKKGGILV